MPQAQPNQQPPSQPKYTPLQGPQNLQPGNITATAPAGYQQFGGLPTVDPTYYQAASVNPQDQQAYLKYYDSLIQKGLKPTFQQQDLGLQQDLASRGIQDSSAASYNMGNLYSQQGATVAQQEAPMVSQAFGYTQQDVLANQAAQNQANATNAAASNAASDTNAGYYNQAVTGNEGAYNAYQNSLFGAGTQWQNSLLSSYLNSFGPQTGVTNALGEAEAGAGSAYGNIYGSALSSQAQELQALGEAAAAGG